MNRKMQGIVATASALLFAGMRAGAQSPDTERRGPREGVPPPAGNGTAAVEAAAAVLGRDAVVQAAGLTEEQRAELRRRLQPEKLRIALAADQLAEALRAVLADPDVIADLGWTEEQAAAVRPVITPALVREAIPAPDILRLARALFGGPAGAGFLPAVREAMRPGGGIRSGPGGGRGGLGGGTGPGGGGRWGGTGGNAPGGGAIGGGTTGGPGREAAQAEFLKRFDKDGDGRLSDEERAAAREMWRAPRR